MVDFDQSDMHSAVRLGAGKWAGLKSVRAEQCLGCLVPRTGRNQPGQPLLDAERLALSRWISAASLNHLVN